MSDLKKQNPNRLVWLDLETNGLDPAKGVGCIFEIAMTVTDERLNVIASGSSLIRTPDARPAGDWCNDYTRKMHTENGLLAEIDACFGASIELVEDACIRFLRKHDAEQAPMCGSSIHFDRTWLREHMPELEAVFHYRNFDATGIAIAARSIGAVFPALPSAHRAAGDVARSIQLAKLGIDYGTGWRALWCHVRAMGRVVRRMLGGAP